MFAPSGEHQTTISSPYKQMKTPTKKNSSTRGLISRPTENMAPPMNNNRSSNSTIHAGLFFATPPPQSLSLSYPPYYSLPALNNALIPHNPQMNPKAHHQQPPLLPLPIPKPPTHLNNSLPSRTRSLPFQPSTKKANNRTRDHSLTPKKSNSKQPRKRSVEEPPKKESLIVASTVPSGPDPNDLPKNVAFPKVVMPPPFAATGNNDTELMSDDAMKDLEMFSGSFSAVLSPPPSSLPLPKFSVRPKLLSCTVEAAGGAAVDAGATDNLCRLLRLR
ncbi:hypothetical protein Tsubulata_044761 [Turnera subulata]|uniref:Uncharacterized protein n=1 Tax=Turnera subulata TaxID=218843 RepID=A0A9Q0G199_9ROSI|nr:hypothetical protein Tsubulata_044761 [Turnera subulata]